MPEVLANALVREHGEALLTMERAELQRLRRPFEEARTQLLGRLGEFEVDTFSAQQLRSVRAQVGAVLATLHRRLDGDAGRLVTEGLERGVDELLEEIAYWEADFRGGATQRVRVDAVVRLTAERALLLDRYRASLRAYTENMRGELGNRLAAHLAMNSKWDDMARDLAGRKGLLAGSRWRADRIVRTEMVSVLNAGRDAALEEAEELLPGLARQWDAHLDERTSNVCRLFNGRVRKVGRPFGVVRGRPILRPPSLPNCRSVLLAWHRDWTQPGRGSRSATTRARLAKELEPLRGDVVGADRLIRRLRDPGSSLDSAAVSRVFAATSKKDRGRAAVTLAERYVHEGRFTDRDFDQVAAVIAARTTGFRVRGAEVGAEHSLSG